MTFLEKWKEDNPKAKLPNGVVPIGCPFNFGYEQVSDCKGMKCVECWNREMPSTEIKQKVANPPTQETLDFIHANIEKIQPHFENPVIEKAYNKGLNDAWELARKINNMEFKEFIKVFERTGYDGREVKMHLIDELTPQEALAKLKAYEEAQEQRKIKVGNVVENKIDTVKAVVMDNGSQEFLWQVFTENGCIELWKECEFKKTGKHLEIQQILEQIGE